MIDENLNFDVRDVIWDNLVD